MTSFDLGRFHRQVDQYLDSDEGQKFLGSNQQSFVVNLILTILALALGVLLVCTVVLLWVGLKCLYFAITLRAFRNPGASSLTRRQELQPLLVSPVIIGPTGASLVLGSFDEETQRDLAFLVRKSDQLGKIYTQGADSALDRQMEQILRKDTYTEGRRQLVPDTHNEGRELLLMDARLVITEGRVIEDGHRKGVVTPVLVSNTSKESGILLQLPWSVADGCLDVADLG